MKAYTFKPQYKSIIWGGDKIGRLKQAAIDVPNLGESWEISSVPGFESVVDDDCDDAGLTISQLIDKYHERLLGTKVYQDGDNSFPLLIKFIDAQRDLSVQVHPNDELAYQRHNLPGKSEMWYVLDAEPGAEIYCGLSAPLSPESYRQCVQDSNIMDFVAAYKSKPGQFYFVPAGTLHAIGAGNLVAEIQQTSDITYRVYDYDRLGADGKPRQLHTELACDAIDYTFPKEVTPTALIVNQTRTEVVKSSHFTADFIKLNGEETHAVSHKGESFRIIMVTDGSLTLDIEGGARSYPRGTTILIPACITSFTIQGPATALLISR